MLYGIGFLPQGLVLEAVADFAGAAFEAALLAKARAFLGFIEEP
jgi:hypothetical protein